MASRFTFGARRNAEASTQQIYETARRNGAPTMGPNGLGGVLRERREAMGVTLAEAEVATRIRQKYLAALESDEWQLLPGEVVGRGFLRNYATYLGLEPTEIIERRRSITEPVLSGQLVGTSAGSMLPPVRQVDYRPKEVDLRDEPDVMETRDIRMTPILAALAVLALAVLLWFGRDTIGGAATGIVDGIQAQFANLTAQREASPAQATLSASSSAAGVVNPQNIDGAASDAPAASDSVSASGQVPQASGSGETVTGSDAVPNSSESDANDGGDDAAATESPSGSGALAALIPTATPTVAEIVDSAPTEAPVVEEPTPEPPTPEPPTATPVVLEPTATPTEEPTPEPVVVPPACADGRSLILAPGAGQVVSGPVAVTGTAAHEAFGYYKLEFAPGANAEGGFVYFAGAESPVSGGLLGTLNTTALGNGAYTVQLTVVDATGNFPPPCRVSITVQN